MTTNPLIPFVGSGAAGAVQVLTSAADIHTWGIPFKCKVRQIGFSITTTVSSASAPVIEFDRIPYGVSGDREAAFDSLTLTTTAAAGKTYYANLATLKLLYPGDQVAVQVATASSSAGQGFPWMIVEVVPEEPDNISAMVESA